MGAAFSNILRSWITTLVNHLGNSDYLAGMLAMSVIAFGRDAAASAWQALLVWFMRRMWVTIRLEEKEAELLRAWLRDRPEVHGSAELAVYSRRGVETGSRVYEFEPEIETTSRLRVTGKDGRSQWIWVTQGANRSATVSFVGRNKKVLDFIFEQGHAIQKRKREKELTVVQVYDFGGETGLHWLHPQERVAKQPGRPVSSVVLPRCSDSDLDQGEALLRDAREFLASENWYSKRGIPYRRGYLLHGVPGGGKSSIVMAIAHELQLPIYMLSLSSEKMCDDKLNQLLQFGMYDPPTILLLEDVDLLHSAVLHRRSLKHGESGSDDENQDKDKKETEGESSEKRQKKSQLTLSGLLNALDGPTATTGRLLFMTTNARERLDPALIRSGRIDYEVEFKFAEQEQIQRLFCHFYSDFQQIVDCCAPPEQKLDSVIDAHATDNVQRSSCGKHAEDLGEHSASDDIQALAKKFAEQVSASGVDLTTADIQRHLVKHKTDPHRSLKEMTSLLRGHESIECDSVSACATKEGCQDAGVQADLDSAGESSKESAALTPLSSPEISPEGVPATSLTIEVAAESQESAQTQTPVISECDPTKVGNEHSEDEGSVPEKTPRADSVPERVGDGLLDDTLVNHKVPACAFWLGGP